MGRRAARLLTGRSRLSAPRLLLCASTAAAAGPPFGWAAPGSSAARTISIEVTAAAASAADALRGTSSTIIEAISASPSESESESPPVATGALLSGRRSGQGGVGGSAKTRARGQGMTGSG